ncbi:hypothetical protein A2U01_0018316, partial [Trifolium medium]|nr:hypothetical protein [Trifolium medium]
MKAGERKGSSSSVRHNERVEFYQFVESMELIDLPVTGKKFSWFCADGKTMSRLDHFLLSDNFIAKEEVNNCWLKHPEFTSFVAKTWDKLNITGKKAFVIKEKLKRLKEEFELGVVDKGGINKKFWDQLRFKESLIKQKSRSKWVSEGDSNTRFFHASIKSRRRRNQMVMLRRGDEWIQGVENIKLEVKNHFAVNFTEEWDNRPFVHDINFKELSEEDNFLLLQ